MAYCDHTDVSTACAIGLSSLLTGTANADMDALCTRVSARMDGILSTRYLVPVTTPAEAVAALRDGAIQIVLLELVRGRLAAEHYKTFQDAAEEVMKWLRELRDSETSLPGSPALVEGQDPAGDFFSSEDPVFTDGGLI